MTQEELDKIIEQHQHWISKIKDFNLMYNIECASGFHFFRTREEAEKY
jgi:predicted nuclease of restriction endonuclease-like RecB superfamily